MKGRIEMEMKLEMKLENEKVMKCKDCKYFQKERLPRSKSGWCLHEKWKNGCWGDHSPLIGCGTFACGDFKQR